MKIINEIIELTTGGTLDFIDVTDRIEEKIKAAGIKAGLVNIHTTMAMIVNEAEPLLIADMKVLLEKLAPQDHAYQHDNFEIRTVNMCDGECANGHSHNKSIHLPTSTLLNVLEGALQLGTWQRVFAVELDRSRPRKIALQLIGE
jgi:secondary thiamine-phosphate synthase enzyme